MSASYGAFEELVIDTDHAKNLELLCNLAQLLFNSVAHRHLTIDEAKLEERITRLIDRLKPMTIDASRPRVMMGVAASVFVATCYVEDPQQAIKDLFESEAVLDRIGMIVVAGNSRHRIFKRALSRLGDWTRLATTTFTLEPSRPVITRRALSPSKDDEDEAAADNQSAPRTPKDHRDLSVRSVIDVHLWNRAGWSGTAFAHWNASTPPAIALMFTDEDAARKIFMRWRDRVGRADKQGEIYVAIVRGISTDHPAYYRVLITSQLPPAREDSRAKTFVMASRMLTMHAESDVNLSRFLAIYGQSRAYLLVPAVLKAGAPEFIPELAILKWELSVKMASEVKEHDLEAIALRSEA